MSKLVLKSLASAVAIASLAACGGGGGGSTGGGDGGGNGGGGNGGGDNTGGANITCNDTTNVCSVSGRFTEDFTFTADKTWLLNGTVAVGDGNELRTDVPNPVNATLTIDAGTSIKGASDGALVVTRGSKIMAQGTSSDPIIFSSADNDFDGNGEWGGLILQGYAKNNICGPEGTGDFANCDILGEGRDVFYFGGDNDADNSGVLDYVIIAEGGTEISPDNEINGLTLMSVGSGTSISNIQVHGNKDDGIEFFGGTVDVTNLILTENGDESVDWDEGYTGTVNNIYVKQKAGFGDHLIEADNAGPSNGATPVSNPTISNAIFISADLDEGIRLSKGTNATLSNVQVFGLSDEECFDLDSEGTNITLTNVVFDGCSALDKDQKDDAGNVTEPGATEISGLTLEDLVDESLTAPAAPAWTSFALPGTL